MWNLPHSSLSSAERGSARTWSSGSALSSETAPAAWRFKGPPTLLLLFRWESLRAPPSPSYYLSYMFPLSTWKYPGYWLSPTLTILLSPWPRLPTEPTFASFRNPSHRSRERPPQSISPSPFRKRNWSTGGLPGGMSRRAPSWYSLRISSSIHRPGWNGWALSSPLSLTRDPTSPGGTLSRTPLWRRFAASLPLGWAFPPTSVSPRRVCS